MQYISEPDSNRRGRPTTALESSPAPWKPVVNRTSFGSASEQTISGAGILIQSFTILAFYCAHCTYSTAVLIRVHNLLCGSFPSNTRCRVPQVVIEAIVGRSASADVALNDIAFGRPPTSSGCRSLGECKRTSSYVVCVDCSVSELACDRRTTRMCTSAEFTVVNSNLNSTWQQR